MTDCLLNMAREWGMIAQRLCFFGRLGCRSLPTHRNARYRRGFDGSMSGSADRSAISPSGVAGIRSGACPNRLHHTTRMPNALAEKASQAFDDRKQMRDG